MMIARTMAVNGISHDCIQEIFMEHASSSTAISKSDGNKIHLMEVGVDLGRVRANLGWSCKL